MSSAQHGSVLPLRPNLSDKGQIFGVTTGVIWIIIGSPFGLEVLWPAGVAGILVMVIGSLLAETVSL